MLFRRVFAIYLLTLFVALLVPIDVPTQVAVAKDPNPPAPTTPELTLPKTKTAKPNRYFCIKPTTNCKTVKWIVPAGLDQIDPEIPLKDTLAVVLIGDTGTYTVQAYGALGDQASDIASCAVTIGTPPPPAPPVPPTPPNPLTAALQAAYNLDADADKATSLKFLVNVYTGMMQIVKDWATVNTVADAVTTMSGIIQSPGVGLNNTQVLNLRKAIMADFVSTFGSVGTKPIALSDLAMWVGKISTALAGVK